MDVRSVTHDTVHDSAKVTSTDPRSIYIEAVVTSITKIEGRTMFSRTALRILPVILGSILTKSVRFPMDVRSVTHDTVPDNAKVTSTDTISHGCEVSNA